MLRLLNLLPSPLKKRLFVFFALISRPMTLGVRGLVTDTEGRVLLVRHTYVPGWYLPGGGVERGETLIDSVVKELAEEANIRLTARPRHFHTYRNTTTSRFDHVALFLCDEWESLGEKKPDREIAETGFFPLNDLPQDTTAPTRKRLAEIFDGKAVEDLW